MKLRHIELTHYRNYQHIALDFSDGVQIFIGENAQGKTNLMESIHVLSMTKSHRTSRDKELIGWDQDSAFIQGMIEKKTGQVPLQLQITSKGKIAKVNHLEQKKLSAYVGQLNAILFAPEHLNLVKGAPAIRRRFVDMELGQMNPIYLFESVQYAHLLKQRNSYLKQCQLKRQPVDENWLEVMTQQLAEKGATLLYHRLQFIKDLETLAQPIHQQISKGKEVLTIHYESSLLWEEGMDLTSIQLRLLQEFQNVRQKEREQAKTLIGPHRDDLVFEVNGYPVQTYGSQGQQRSTVLSLKLAEIELMKQKTGEYPILLLDDVLSELDDERQTHLIKAIENKVQTFLTTTSLDGIQQQFIQTPSIFKIDKGNVLD